MAARLGDAGLLMARAGQAAWQTVLDRWPAALRIAVVCGPGNNGGDGYVLARHALEAGRDVVVVRLEEHAPRSELARHAAGQFLAVGGRVVEGSGGLPTADLVVDALFGIGFAREPSADVATLLRAINGAGVPVLALDVPSGVDADCGALAADAVRADVTLEFLLRKRGLATGAVLDHVGEYLLADLGVTEADREGIPIAAKWLDAGLLPALLPHRARDSHKGHHGRVSCLGGDLGHGGAIIMAAEAALRAGAGLVDVGTRAEHVAALLARRPEAMPHAVNAGDAAMALADLTRSADVIALGPGLGRDAWGQGLFEVALGSGKPLVVDADALNLLASAPRSLGAECILTPHPGEAARLLGTDASSVQRDRFAAAQALVQRFSAVVVLKGAGTLVAAPNEVSRVIGAGNPGMAVGGMGDVLTGVIAALRGQGLSAVDAATAGALLHAAAGDAAAAVDGPIGLLPGDLMSELRRLRNAGEEV
ncbi:NAD(P)H-hydrate epimerase [Lysobacter ruishenii]|uniref:Bifunctional NAD(P)H-hydrate repair enzyme n=2 Tax=Aerolutibacter ruishenii TaxID=686800 RepID=A0A562LYB2_9GAMM|nr:NAD(P)H-hydrate epimerase [Lysobacter ruishenii]